MFCGKNWVKTSLFCIMIFEIYFLFEGYSKPFSLLLFQLTAHVGNVKIDKPKINYLKFETKDPDVDMEGIYTY